MTKMELFLELAKPDAKGESRWVSVSEFTGKYIKLVFGNGADWARASSTLSKKYKIEFDKSKTKGNSVDAVRLTGFNTKPLFNQSIRKDIRDALSKENCVMLGIKGHSENTKIEIDHKDGRKNDSRVSDLTTQKLSDFQPLCKAANNVKRQICKLCKETNKRWNAQNIKGNPYPFYVGDEKWDDNIGCKGCYQYDPVEYRKESIKKISAEAADYISRKLFGEDK